MLKNSIRAHVTIKTAQIGVHIQEATLKPRGAIGVKEDDTTSVHSRNVGHESTPDKKRIIREGRTVTREREGHDDSLAHTLSLR